VTYTAPGARHPVQEVTYNAASQVLTCNAEIDGVLVDPSGTSTCAVYANGGDTVLSSGNCTDTSGVLTYSFSTTDTSKFVPNQIYRALFSFVSSSKTYQREVFFVVARVVTEDACPITLNDLRGMHMRFDSHLAQQSQGTDGAGRYVVPAWEEVRETIESSGIRPSVVNPASLKSVTKYAAACNLCRGLFQQPGDTYEKLLGEYKRLYAEAMVRLVLLHKPGDGLAVTADRGVVTQPTLSPGPDRSQVPVTVWGPNGVHGGGPFGGLR
jgi:hypothetical protein